MEHPLRDHTRKLFAGALGEGPVSRNAERSVYNWSVQRTREMGSDSSWEARLFRWRYKMRVLNLMEHLKRSKGTLAQRIGTKELEAKNLARYPAEVLDPDGPVSRMQFKLKAKELAYEAEKAKKEDYEGLFKCGRCKGKRTTFYQLQTRSADEPMVRACQIVRFFLKLTRLRPADYVRHLHRLREQVEVLKCKTDSIPCMGAPP